MKIGRSLEKWTAVMEEMKIIRSFEEAVEFIGPEDKAERLRICDFSDENRRILAEWWRAVMKELDSLSAATPPPEPDVEKLRTRDGRTIYKKRDPKKNRYYEED